MNVRLRVMESLPAAAARPYSSHMPSTSFTSFSSSNLDTEINQSTASFFQDHSMSLGRLIGFRPGERGGIYVPNSVRLEDQHRISTRDAHPDVSGHRVDMSRVICIPLALGALIKMSRSKSKLRK
ncbi:hypothetical protein FCV25MIE_32659 [Fagus crenata]